MYPFGNIDFILGIHITTVVQQEAHQIAGRTSLLLKSTDLGKSYETLRIATSLIPDWGVG